MSESTATVTEADEDRDSVSKVMSKTVYTATPKEVAANVLKLMVKHDIGSIVIVESGKPVAIVTERDIVRKLANGNSSLNEPVSKIASKPLVTAAPNTQVWEAFATMLRKKIRRLPVVEGNKLVGIVTERDLFKWVVAVAYEPNVPEDLKQQIAKSN